MVAPMADGLCVTSASPATSAGVSPPHSWVMVNAAERIPIRSRHFGLTMTLAARLVNATTSIYGVC